MTLKQMFSWRKMKFVISIYEKFNKKKNLCYIYKYIYFYCIKVAKGVLKLFAFFPPWSVKAPCQLIHNVL